MVNSVKQSPLIIQVIINNNFINITIIHITSLFRYKAEKNSCSYRLSSTDCSETTDLLLRVLGTDYPATNLLSFADTHSDRFTNERLTIRETVRTQIACAL
jgi:hypothetical protein